MKAKVQINHQVLREIALTLIPNSDDYPSVDELKLTGHPIRESLEYQAKIAPMFLDTVSLCDADHVKEWLINLEARQPERFESIVQIIFAAYFTHPLVQDSLNYPGQEVRTLDKGGFGAEDLLLELMKSPPRYRSTV